MPAHANKEYGLKCQCHKYFLNKIKPKVSTHYRYFCLFHKTFRALFKPALSEDKEIVLRAIQLYMCVTADFTSQSDPCPLCPAVILYHVVTRGGWILQYLLLLQC